MRRCEGWSETGPATHDLSQRPTSTDSPVSRALRRCRAGAASDRARGSAASSCRRTAACRPAARPVEVASVSTAARVRRPCPPREQPRARQHLVEHDAERPDVGALVDGFAARLLGRHVARRCRESRPCWVAAGDSVGELREAAAPVACTGAERLGQPEIQHLHRAVVATLMLAGLRSRWTMPCSCAASSASAICRAMRQRLVDRDRRRRSRRSARVGPSTSSITSARACVRRRLLDAVDLRDVRMVERRQRLRFALEATQSFRIGGEGLRQNLQRDVTIEPGVASPIDLAHSAGAERCRRSRRGRCGTRRPTACADRIA